MSEQENSAQPAGEEQSALSQAIERFELYSGVEFDRLGDRLGSLAEAARSAPRRAILTAVVGWGVLLVLTLIAGKATAGSGEGAFLRDIGALARFGIAAPLLMLMDRRIDAQLRVYLSHFVQAPLLSPNAMPAAAQAVASAIDRARSRVALLICVVCAYLLSFSAQTAISHPWPSWRVAGPDAADGLSIAGWWMVLVAAPLFWFLLLRAFWRYFVWSLLLRRIAKLELRLVASHPDGAGGLGFLGQHPNVFSALVFAMSISVAGAVAHTLGTGRLTIEAYGWLLSAWVAITIGIFAAPLTAFARPLGELRRKTRFAAAARATVNKRAEERDIFGRNIVAPADGTLEEPAADKDASKIDEVAKKLTTIPFSRAALLPLAAAALLPLLAAGASRLPLKELISAAKRLLLL